MSEVDSGFYSCAAVSSSGSVMWRAELRVASSATALRHPPIIELGPANQGHTTHFKPEFHLAETKPIRKET